MPSHEHTLELNIGQYKKLRTTVGQAVPHAGVDPAKLPYWTKNSQELEEKIRYILARPGQKLQVIVNVILNCSARLDPAKFIRNGYGFWRGPVDGDGLSGERDWDERSYALTQINFSQVAFLTCLKDREPFVSGEEKYNRLKADGRIRLGANVFLALWLDYKVNGENSILEWLRKNKGITYLDFFGDILRDSFDIRSVLYLHGRGGGWRWGCRWLGDGRNADASAAVLAS